MRRTKKVTVKTELKKDGIEVTLYKGDVSDEVVIHKPDQFYAGQIVTLKQAEIDTLFKLLQELQKERKNALEG
jgi:hypothetical protein